MRSRSQTTFFVLGAAALGVTAALLLDGDSGRRRRRRIADGVSAAGHGSVDAATHLGESLSASAGSAVNYATQNAASAAQYIADHLRDAAHSASEAAADAAHAVSAHTSRAADNVSDGYDDAHEAIAESLDDKGAGLSAKLHAIAGRVGGLAATLGSSLGSLPTGLLAWPAKQFASRRVSGLRESVADQVAHYRPTGRLANSIGWRDVEDAIAGRRRRSYAVPAISGAGLLLIGVGVYYFGLSRKAGARRRALGYAVNDTVSSVGKLASGIGAKFRSARPDSDQLAGLVQTAVSGVSQFPEDLQVAVRDGDIVLQGTATTDDYNAIVEAAERVAPGFTNELQAIAV